MSYFYKEKLEAENVTIGTVDYVRFASGVWMQWNRHHLEIVDVDADCTLEQIYDSNLVTDDE